MNTQEMVDKLQGLQRRAGETAKNFGAATDDYVRENTWTTIAMAALLGCVIGYILVSNRD
jgi:ElaB/YqjD/DUF883 family membrane-anchored ribosome-binding protein